jgi:fatty-acyl-CoA synthase
MREIRQARDFVAYLRRLVAQGGFTAPSVSKLIELLLSGRKDTYGPVFAHALSHPDKPALIEGGRVTTYEELRALSCRLGNGLRDRGVAKGHKIVIALGNVTEAIISAAAAAHAGIQMVPCSTHYKAQELAHIVTHSEAQVVCLTQRQWQEVKGTATWANDRTVAVLEGSDGDAIAWSSLLGRDGEPKRERSKDADMMIYTSGTTGKPKGAVLNTHRIAYLRAVQLMGAFDIHRGTKFYTACPVYHAAPVAFIGFVLASGGTVHIDDAFDAAAVWKYLDDAEITTAFMVPTQIVRLLALPEEVLRKKPRALQRLYSGGAPLPLAVKERAQKHLGNVLCDFYGATELGLVSLALPEDLRTKPGTIGRPLPGVTVKFFADHEGPPKEVKPGERGLLHVTSDQFDFDYYKNEEATMNTYHGKFRTVLDIGYADEDGYLFVVDRQQDLIISGGVNIYPAEIEGVLLQHPAIEDAAVVGAPDDEWGEKVIAFVVTRAGKTLDETSVVAHCQGKLASLKKPKQVVFVDALPRSPQGKVLKRELRQRIESKSVA